MTKKEALEILDEVVATLNDEAYYDWYLYEKNYGDGRVEYLYGPSWKAQELLVEGGYPTPEEAKEVWLREHVSR